MEHRVNQIFRNFMKSKNKILKILIVNYIFKLLNFIDVVRIVLQLT